MRGAPRPLNAAAAAAAVGPAGAAAWAWLSLSCFACGGRASCACRPAKRLVRNALLGVHHLSACLESPRNKALKAFVAVLGGLPPAALGVLGRCLHVLDF